MTRFASYQVCDQVAQGGMGKLAFLGIYGTDILVPSVPFRLEQLFFIVKLRATIDDLPTRLVVRIERPGHEPFLVDQSDALPKNFEHRPDATFFDAQAIVRLAPFEIEAEGTVKVFVEDERGDNYAGGLRLRIGVHPEASMPRIAESVVLASGHYNRLRDTAAPLRQKTAVELIEALTKLVASSGLPTALSYPDADMRLLVDNQRIHVFFPQPLEDERFSVDIEPSPSFDDVTIESADQVGFVARFEPSAPPDAVFNYTLTTPENRSAGRKAPDTAKPPKAKRR
ncbi:hypothetical protein [Bradyrhizobium sp. RT10b]|uniref:DUF6941 family protein n=1 Tax=Bradyrhizobium sp. RT10b TaxID=3156331 RepID=UPI00339556F7